ncbi:hypothetical protein DY78_GL002690 [Lactiplantibacillus fabifermentans DSM 21115]|uniref:Uncharacterized protein n=1 Tax=Lactiplantibacillus fabifermentans DSM 21115 TaxID=1413187 RepID=A0A0R2NQT1_9LACO|nr:hypothetical protein DY78_GL002690 [Lactiplantibacillus fabifermentans DSM 21115]
MQRQGNTNIFPIPKDIQVPVDAKYHVYQDTDGCIVYVPIKKDHYDIWADSTLNGLDFEALRQQELADLGYDPRKITPVGSEKTKA